MYSKCLPYRTVKSRNDRCVYRSREEEEQWQQRCPIERTRNQLNLSTDDFAKLEQKSETRVLQSVTYALDSPLLSLSETLQGTFSDQSRSGM